MAGEWDTQPDCLKSIIDQYDNALWYWYLNVEDIGIIWSLYWTGEYTDALGGLINVVESINDAIQAIIIPDMLFTYDPPFALPYYLKNYGVNWRGICSAWVADDFEGKYWTIACIDRMRQLIWDKPFDIIWAGKPEAKEI